MMTHIAQYTNKKLIVYAKDIILLALLIGLLTATTSALMIELDTDSLANGADSIIIGTITSTSVAWNNDHTHIITTANVAINETLKGNFKQNETIPVIIEGGTVDDVTEWVEDQPTLNQGAEVALFLEKNNQNNYTVYGLYQGVIPINGQIMEKITKGTEKSTLNAVKAQIQNSLDGKKKSTDLPIQSNINSISPTGSPTITSVTPNSASAGTETIITITGTGFGTKANRESNADVAFTYKGSTIIWATGFPYFSSNVNDIISWTNTQIQVKVPTGVCSDSYSGGASSGYLYVLDESNTRSAYYPFTVTFSYGKSHWNSNPTYSVNPSPYTSSIIGGITRAGTSWNNAGSLLRINYGGTTAGAGGSSDGNNILSWGVRPSGVIATAWRWTSGEHMTECDIVFSTAFSWVTTNLASGSVMNMETITLHEMGHWLCLKDLYGNLAGYPQDISPARKIMFGINGDGYGNKNDVTLTALDIAGIQWIYPGSVVIPTTWYLDDNLDTIPEIINSYGLPTDTPLTGDWNSDGIPRDGVGVKRGNVYYLDYNFDNSPDRIFAYGASTDTPLIGDWNGDGMDGIGVKRGNVYYLDNNLDNIPDRIFAYGASTDTPLTGDWNGDNMDGIGVRRGNVFYLDNNFDNVPDRIFAYGLPTDEPITGDWDGDHIDGVALKRGNIYYVDNNIDGIADYSIAFGLSTDIPVVKDWNGDWWDGIGVFRPGVAPTSLDKQQSALVLQPIAIPTVNQIERAEIRTPTVNMPQMSPNTLVGPARIEMKPNIVSPKNPLL